MSREHLEAIWRAGVEACLPERVVPTNLPEPPRGRTLLLALGKAAVTMAEAVESRWKGPLSGLAVAPHGTVRRLERIELVTAAHPVPDEASMSAAHRLLALAAEEGPDDLVLVLLSGGASSLVCLPGNGLTLEEKQEATRALLRSGAAVGEVNCVRRHLSLIKGGRLALAAAPARVVTLAISDVVGDGPADIGSGPTVADPTTLPEARAILERYGVTVPKKGWSESPKDVCGDYRIVARGRDAVEAAAAKARALGYDPHLILYDAEGEARAAGRAHAELAIELTGPAALISGGELIVTVRGDGCGGPNCEYAAAAAARLADTRGIGGLAADTDGLDGTSGGAGGFFGSGGSEGAEAALAANDSAAWLAARGDLFAPGPTGTNVNDLRIILVAP